MVGATVLAPLCDRGARRPRSGARAYPRHSSMCLTKADAERIAVKAVARAV